MSAAHWYRDRQARWLIVARYLPWLAALNLSWEVAQLPLYTLWQEDSPGYIAFAVAHCTAGDILIGIAALLAALTLLRAGAAAGWPWAALAATTIVFGVSYTIFSEWLNATVLESWKYSSLMPTLRAGGLEIGVAPVLQWIGVPGLALYMTRKALQAESLMPARPSDRRGNTH